MKWAERMRRVRCWPSVTSAACLLVSTVAAAQSRSAAPSTTMIVSSGNAAYDLNPRPDSGEVRREIRDPHTGQVWLLSLDPANPGGPGRLIPAAPQYSIPPQSTPAPQTQPSMNRSAAARLEPSPAPIIHAGDRVTLEEETPTVSARLEAIALGPAAAGAPLRVRLRLGGQIVPAIAVTARRVALAQVLSAQGAQP